MRREICYCCFFCSNYDNYCYDPAHGHDYDYYHHNHDYHYYHHDHNYDYYHHDDDAKAKSVVQHNMDHLRRQQDPLQTRPHFRSPGRLHKLRGPRTEAGKHPGVPV